MVSTVRLASALFVGALSLTACSSSSSSAGNPPASNPPAASQAGSSSAANSASTSESSLPTTGDTSAGTAVSGAAGDCARAQNAVEAMASVMPQSSMVKKVSLSADCKTMTIWTALTASQASVALAICSQIDSPAYAGGAESVAIATADGKVVLAKGSKGQACKAGL